MAAQSKFNYRKLTAIAAIVVFVFSAIAYFLLLKGIWNFNIDDAFICLRYSEHLAQGHGFSWNIGEKPTEGCVNLIWMVLNAISFRIGANPIIFVKILGIISACLVVLFIFLVTKRIFRSEKEKHYIAFAVCSAIFLANPATAIHTVSGLETMLYSAFLLLTVYLAFVLLEEFSASGYAAFSFVAFITSMLRPEAMAVAILLSTFILFYTFGKDGRKVIKESLPFVYFFILPIIMIFICKFLYFGSLVPLPYLVKSGGSIIQGVLSFILNLKYLIGAVLVIFLAVFFIEKDKKGATYRCNLFAIASLLTMVGANCVYLTSNLVNNYAQRYFYPSFILLYILSAVCLVLLVSKFIEKSNLRRKDVIRIIFGGLLIFLILIANNEAFVHGTVNYQALKEDTKGSVIYKEVGDILGTLPKNITVATVDAGAIPFYGEINHVDIWGLTNAEIAKAHGISSAEYIKRVNPEVIILTVYQGNLKNLLTENPPRQKPFLDFAKNKGYVQLESIPASRYYSFITFVDGNLSEFKSLNSSLSNVSEEANSITYYPA